MGVFFPIFHFIDISIQICSRQTTRGELRYKLFVFAMHAVSFQLIHTLLFINDSIDNLSVACVCCSNLYVVCYGIGLKWCDCMAVFGLVQGNLNMQFLQTVPHPPSVHRKTQNIARPMPVGRPSWSWVRKSPEFAWDRRSWIPW